MPGDSVKLREKWRQRLFDAKLRLEFARSYTNELSEDRTSGAIVGADSEFGYQRALAAENAALEEFARVAEILKNLVLFDTIPDEDRDQEA